MIQDVSHICDTAWIGDPHNI